MEYVSAPVEEISIKCIYLHVKARLLGAAYEGRQLSLLRFSCRLYLEMTTNNPKVAIIGSGISGLAACYVLLNSKSEYKAEVHVIEKNDHFGGHSESVEWESSGIWVDPAFTLFNKKTYRGCLAACKLQEDDC